ncbi:MAG: segregation/condensation protein A [Firmicutes bacterium]|jgi:segregation and condensation protein A|nr:segregation/condensation protein A [Bacillota bacterium]MDH7495545.1 segregation/condensation protein A [Bacillota bacterium]
MQVNIPGFSGTLEDLARAVERGDVDALSVSVYEVIQTCFEELERSGKPGLEDVGGLLAAASNLIAAKAKALLPPEPQAGESQAESGENEGAAWDTDSGGAEGGREDGDTALIAHLMEYRVFKEAVEELARRDEAWRLVYLRDSLPSEACSARLSGGVSLSDLVQALRRVLEGVSEDEFTALPEDDLSIEDKMDAILARLHRNGRLVFRELFEGAAITRSEVIAVFLALLELIRLAKAVVRQDAHFGDILIMPATGGSDHGV